MGTTTSLQCEAINKSGQPCQSPAGKSGYCWAHDPSVAAERTAARSRGGRARHGRHIRVLRAAGEAPITIETPSDVLKLLNVAIADTLSMEPSLNRARTLSSLAEAALRVFQATGLEERLKALEQLTGGNHEQQHGQTSEGT